MASTAPMPQAIEAEQALLGGLILDPEQVEAVEHEVAATDFYRPDHARLFALLKEMRVGGEHIDEITLADRVTRSGRDADFGGYAYVVDLPEKVPSRVNLIQYARIVREKAVRRAAIRAAEKVLEGARDGEGDVGQLLSRAASELLQVVETEASRDWEQVSRIVDRELVRLHDRAKRRDAPHGVSTGFAGLDDLLLGFHPSQLVILAARPGIGKTALALTFAFHAASVQGKTVGIFSLEMDRGELVGRLLSQAALIDNQKLRRAAVSETEWKDLDAAEDILRGCRLFIDDRPGVTIDDIRTRARRLAALQGGLDLLVVDYLQLMQPIDPRANRVLQVGEMSRGLKLLAKDLRVPVIALSQLSRDIEKRKGEDQRPKLSDLRDSGSIEQDADVIMFIHKDAGGEGSTPDDGRHELVVAKQRAGRLGSVPVVFERPYARFTELEASSFRL